MQRRMLPPSTSGIGVSSAVDLAKSNGAPAADGPIERARGGGTFSVPIASLSSANRGEEGRDSGGRTRRLERAEAAITLVRDSADVLLLDPEGDSVVQSILVDEGTSAASAAVKDAIRDAAVVGPRRVRESLPLGLGQILLPLLPFEGEILPFLEKTHEESRAQDLVRKLVPMLPLPSLPALPPLSDLPAALSSLVGSEGGRSEGDGGESEGADRVRTLLSSLGDAEPEEMALIAKELRESLPRYAPLAGRLGGKVRRVCV